MATLSEHFFASNVEQQFLPGGGHSLQVTNLLPALVLPAMPSAYTFYSVFSIRDFDFNKDHKLNVVFSNSETKFPLYNATMDLKSEKLQEIQETYNSLVPKAYLSIVSFVPYQNVLFMSTGIYKATFTLDTDNIGEREIYVAGQPAK